MPDKRWRGRWELSNSQTQTSENTLKSKSIKTFEIWNFQFPRQFLRLSALPSWLATRCPGETWWTATSTTTGWPGSTALSPASGATRTTSRATPDQRGSLSAESWRSTSPVDRKIFYGWKIFLFIKNISLQGAAWAGLSQGWSRSLAVWTGGSSCRDTSGESRSGTPCLLIKRITSVL